MTRLKNVLKKIRKEKKADQKYVGIIANGKCGCRCQGNFCR
jgi:Mrp family chromosome partitioning ATPase